MEIICMEKQTFDELVVRLSLIEKKVIGLCSQTKDAGLKKWMDNQEVCGVLRISKKTLQVYREKGLLPFTRIKNKFFYKPEDVQSLLESSYHPQKEAMSYDLINRKDQRIDTIFKGLENMERMIRRNTDGSKARIFTVIISSRTRNFQSC